MSFFECEFPRQIRYRRLGSPSGWSTQINQSFSGQENRNRNWANSRGKWTIELMTPGADQVASRATFMQLLLAFHMVVGGKADAFRLKDHTDFSWTTPQTLGTGDGSNAHFQLTKTYTVGGRSYVRNITKPVASSVNDFQGNPLANTVTIALNGTPTSSFTLDATTGIVTMSSPPGAGVMVTSPSGQFHYPVRFDTDDLPMQTEESNPANLIVSINSVNLVEVLPPNF